MDLFYLFENLCFSPRKDHFFHFYSYSVLSRFTELIEICSPIYLGFFSIQIPVRLESVAWYKLNSSVDPR